MNRGTLMVLKRFIVTTLGALGLGALLAAGPASAQDDPPQIPAPDDLAAPDAPPAPPAMGCAVTANTVVAITVTTSDVTDVTTCTDTALTQEADITAAVTAAREADAAVVAARGVVTLAETALETAENGNNPAEIATAQNSLDAAKSRLMAAQAARTALSGESALAKAVLDELDAIRSIVSTGMASTAATARATASGTSVAGLVFDAMGNNVPAGTTGATALGATDATGDGSLYAAYNDAKTTWEALDDNADDAAKAATAMALVDAKHALDAALRDATYLVLKATLDAHEQAAETATKNLETAQKSKTDAGKAISTAIVGAAPPPDDSSDDTVTERIARIAAKARMDLADAKEDQTAKQTAATAAATAKSNADTAHTNAQTRLANARTAYNEAIAADGTRPTDTDELAALVEAEIEYIEAYFAVMETEDAAKTAKTAADATQKALDAANKAVADAQAAVDNPDALAFVFDPMNPAGALTDALLSGEDTGGALVKAIDETWQATQEMGEGSEVDLSGVEGRLDVLLATDDEGMESGRVVDLEDDVTEIKSAVGLTDGMHADDCSNNIACNTAEIEHNDTDIETIQAEVGLDSAGGGTVMLPDGTMGSRLDDHEQKLALKKQYIETLGAEVGINAATGEGTVMLANGMMGSRIDKNAEDIMGLAGEGRTTETVKGNADAIGNLAGEGRTTETVKGNADAIGNLAGEGRTTETVKGNADAAKAAHDAAMAADGKAVAAGNAAMAADGKAVAAGNAAAVADGKAVAAQADATNALRMAGTNATDIGGLQDQMDIVRAGVAASMALAGMPAVNGRGLAIGVGSFDGESAFAVGFQISGEQASFKVGVTSSGGETGVSAGVGFNF